MTLSKRYLITRDLAAVAMGQKPADLILKNSKLVDVCTARIRNNCDVAVYNGFIALVGNAGHVQRGDHTQVVDLRGRYICPGLIDSHMHVESSMVDLPAFAEGVLPHGTTAICPDIHEITNVLGMDALTLFKQSSETLPLKVLTAMPVCVPSLPGMEDAGARIGPDDVYHAYENNLAQLQGEQMNFPGVIFGDEKVHSITAHGLKAGKVMTGHYAGGDLNGGLNAYIASGMMADHETTTPEGAMARAQLGMYVQQRYGSAWLDLPILISAVLENPGLDTRLFTLVTDDVTPATILEKGHLVRVVRKAVQLGLNPIVALQMATINPAQLLEQSQWIGSITPGRAADILVMDSLGEFTINQVYSDGVLVAEDGCMTKSIPGFDYPDWAVNTMHLSHLSPDHFQIYCEPADQARVRVIKLLPGKVNTVSDWAMAPAIEGKIEAQPGQDIAKAAMFYRHKPGTDAEGSHALGLVSGTGFGPKAAYASTVSHDCHNLLVVGMDDQAMALAANTLIDSKGGIVVVEGDEILAHLPLPFGGLMSLDSVKTAAKGVEAIEKAMKEIGCDHPAFEMTMSLLGLVVLGELRLSNRGLVEMKNDSAPEFVNLVLKEGS
jgi:adenine deaminase